MSVIAESGLGILTDRTKSGTCPHCGRPWTGGGRNRVYCSVARQRAAADGRKPDRPATPIVAPQIEPEHAACLEIARGGVWQVRPALRPRGWERMGLREREAGYAA